ncbi:class I SAM-dependent methyltransferase [Salinibacter ruber]|uniref:class I SAM-dependent methyltransferase n=1 Tax=Salinibacter ruber TaxID=146919 RepID=UPI002073A30E|nr:class I SAM-dependent methyltransferase [Salinibacter ruber]
MPDDTSFGPEENGSESSSGEVSAESTSSAVPSERTIRWYDRHAEEYAKWTRQIDLGGLRDQFLGLVPTDGRILDVGCGAGRDLKYFLGRGREAVGLDPSEEMARLASDYAETTVHRCRVQEFGPEEQFDGIWACASLLHVPEGELPAVFERLAGWIRQEGILYASFCAGEDRGQTARFFNDVGREEAAKLASGTKGLASQKIWVSEDSGGRDGVEWVNVLAKRQI